MECELQIVVQRMDVLHGGYSQSPNHDLSRLEEAPARVVDLLVSPEENSQCHAAGDIPRPSPANSDAMLISLLVEIGEEVLVLV
ncbi:hypothetical protein CVT26_002515 [Gymnopilus dilepis]|uniref:Uncharacterized protein n=1 Tax=Gymnopilus dilepis TaxID=231916 RepID=A0A409YND5_9AGAR|nr:hypothetical protein CVT26_002515 [Gymnopilus dilepis]